MFLFTRDDLKEGNVVWAPIHEYYDTQEYDPLTYNQKRMYLIVKRLSDKEFLGCTLTTSTNSIYNVVLSAKHYPLKHDSRIKECLYKIQTADICSTRIFSLESKTFEFFKRKLFEKITIGLGGGNPEYDELFISDFLKTHKPKVNDIVVYSNKTNDGMDHYFVYDADEANYYLVPLSDYKSGRYSVVEDAIWIANKNYRFIRYYDDHRITREEVIHQMDELHGKSLTKKLGSREN